MVRLYIENSVESEFDFVVLDKRHAVAILDISIDKINNIFKKAIDDAALCNVNLAAFIGRHIFGSEKLQSEYYICQKMSRYKLMRDAGFVYDYSNYERDEQKALYFIKENMNSVINVVVGSEDSKVRKVELEKYLNSVSNNSINNFIGIYSHLMDSIQEIYGRIAPDRSDVFANINTAMTTAETYFDVLNMLECAAEISSKAFMKQQGKERVIYNEIKEFIKKNISNSQLSPKMIADYLNTTQRKLSNDFKEEYGRTFLEEINLIRLEKVVELLATTDEPIKSIMIDCGFISESYFYKLFKKYYGITPAEYRRNEKKIIDNERRIYNEAVYIS